MTLSLSFARFAFRSSELNWLYFRSSTSYQVEEAIKLPLQLSLLPVRFQSDVWETDRSPPCLCSTVPLWRKWNRQWIRNRQRKGNLERGKQSLIICLPFFRLQVVIWSVILNVTDLSKSANLQSVKLFYISQTSCISSMYTYVRKQFDLTVMAFEMVLWELSIHIEIF